MFIRLLHSAWFPFLYAAGCPWGLWPALPLVLQGLLYSMMQGVPKCSYWPSFLICWVPLFCASGRPWALWLAVAPVMLYSVLQGIPKPSGQPSLLFFRVSFIVCCRVVMWVSLSALTSPPSYSAGFPLFCATGCIWAPWPALPPILQGFPYSVLQVVL